MDRLPRDGGPNRKEDSLSGRQGIQTDSNTREEGQGEEKSFFPEFAQHVSVSAYCVLGSVLRGDNLESSVTEAKAGRHFKN